MSSFSLFHLFFLKLASNYDSFLPKCAGDDWIFFIYTCRRLCLFFNGIQRDIVPEYDNPLMRNIWREMNPSIKIIVLADGWKGAATDGHSFITFLHGYTSR